MNWPPTAKINVAIDGPAGAGKSTVARKVAETLGYIYVDTGAMYRTVTLKALREGADLDDAKALAGLAERTDIRLVPEPGGQKVIMDGEDVTEPIRTKEVTSFVSKVAAVPDIRNVLVRLQRDIADRRGVVMDGRDIGTNVLPDAEVKVFMTASVRIRAERRWLELKEKDPEATVEGLMEAIAARDKSDSERATSPLKQADDAVLLDTSHLTADEAAERIVRLCRQALEV
ncbi:(d)CMP kinase [Paenibacillus antri]|uniref:Cytidylate kinase n=1 Tax=Paenibacillus antri TaxID=2582848 RepID=A0A5R9GJK3_9BACL|nr:(d)CMP kinase [Paenibacillus antri]TLS53073.1 (d)CMP kinase [Paenibacillus antri]